LKAIFPAWASAIKDPEIESQARKEWLMGLIESRITTEKQISAGLAKCRAHNSPFLPSIGQFVEWCRLATQNAAGLPSESEALSAMIAEIGKPKELRDWARHHPSVFMAYSKRQTYDWKNYKYHELKSFFSECWEEVKQAANGGFDFYSALPKPQDVNAPVTENYLPRDEAIKKSSALLSMLGVDAEKTYHDNEHARQRLEQAKKLLEM
jgi:hypothetical protein